MFVRHLTHFKLRVNRVQLATPHLVGNVCRLAAGGWGGWTFERRFSHLGARTNLVVGPWIEEAENDEDALRDMLEGEGRGGGVPVVGPGTRGGGGDGDGRGGSAAAADAVLVVAEEEEKNDASSATRATVTTATVEWLWEAELNPSRSLQERELHFDESAYMEREKTFMGENCGWQCLVGGAWEDG